MRAFERALAPIAGDYHLIVIDSPRESCCSARSSSPLAGSSSYRARSTRAVSTDRCVFETAAEVRDTEGLNPDLEILGAFLGPIQNGAARQNA